MSEAVQPARARQGASSLRWALAGLNALGGLAVLASYSLLFTREGAGEILWGGVPERLRPLYTTNMWLAAAGYFPMTALFLRADPERARFLGGRSGYGLLFALYALVLVPSALWMPLTFAFADAPGRFGFWLIRLDLAAVGVGSLGLLACVATIAPRPPRWLHFLALFGALAFCFQTAVLDGAVWPAYYPQP